MSWLLVASVPVLLMLAAFGLQKLETGLCETPAADAQASAPASPHPVLPAVRPAPAAHHVAAPGLPAASVHRSGPAVRVAHNAHPGVARAVPAAVLPVASAALPTTHNAGHNPGFRRTRHADRV